jgi:hypothetical protein
MCRRDFCPIECPFSASTVRGEYHTRSPKKAVDCQDKQSDVQSAKLPWNYQMAQMTAQFCAAVSVMFNTLASSFSERSGMNWVPQHGWAYSGGQWTDASETVEGGECSCRRPRLTSTGCLRLWLRSGSCREHVCVGLESLRFDEGRSHRRGCGGAGLPYGATSSGSYTRQTHVVYPECAVEQVMVREKEE